jgi:hypothetical protein
MDTTTTNDQVWQKFQQALADCLGDLDYWDSLIISARHLGSFVQFSGDGPGTPMRAEATPKFSPRKAPPSEDECLAMQKLGWSGLESYGNFFINDEHPGDYSRLAELAVRTLREMHGISLPRQLQYRAFSCDPGTPEIRFPSLKIHREPADRG